MGGRFRDKQDKWTVEGNSEKCISSNRAVICTATDYLYEIARDMDYFHNVTTAPPADDGILNGIMICIVDEAKKRLCERRNRMFEEARRRLLTEDNIDSEITEEVSPTYANSACMLRRLLNEVIKCERDYDYSSPMRQLREESEHAKSLVGMNAVNPRKRKAANDDRDVSKINKNGRGRGKHLGQWMKKPLAFVNGYSVCNVCSEVMKEDLIGKDVMMLGSLTQGTVVWQLRHMECHNTSAVKSVDKGKENKIVNMCEVVDLSNDDE
jgi:hypothetical protein